MEIRTRHPVTGRWQRKDQRTGKWVYCAAPNMRPRRTRARWDDIQAAYSGDKHV